MKLTVRKIAEEAGVSPATVSRVINGGPGIGKAVRERILEILSRNPDAVRKRKSKKRENIALMMPEHGLNYRDFFEKIKVFLNLFDGRWNLLLIPHDISADELERFRVLNEIRGLILFGFQYPTPEIGAVVQKIPHVWINSHRTGSSCDGVLMGNEYAGRLAARYLIARKCRDCVYLEMQQLNPGVPVRFDGFRFEFFSQKKTCRALRLELPEPLEKLSPSQLEPFFNDAVKSGLFNGADGIFLSEIHPVPVLHLALRRFGGRTVLPSLVCCGYSEELLAGLWPRPAAITLGEELLAEYACRDLFRRIEGTGPADSRAAVFVSPQLILPEA